MNLDMTCPSVELLRRSLDPDDPMSEDERGRIEDHLASCPRDCKKVIAALVHGDTLRDAKDLPASDTRPGPASAPAADPVRKVPGYEILGELGRGGMGVVYKARQVDLDRLVALKMIHGGRHAGADELQRFQREARAVAQLAHANIVQIHEIGACEGQPYIALEFVAGGSLQDKLARGTMTAPAAAALVRQLAVAMNAVHQRGILHRDLKPGNILLTPDGQPKITDFGLAKRDPSVQPGNREQPDGALTQSGAVLGTPSYMAPEQAGGPRQLLSPATDVYALGAILYEALTGRPPFQAQSALDVLIQVVSAEPAPLRRLRADVPRDLETICLKCLRKSPRDRYPSAQEFADDLARFLEGRPIHARRISLPERAVKGARRHPAALLSVLLVLLVVAGSAAALLLWKAGKDASRTFTGAERDEEQIEYFANFVKRWGLPEGVGRLTEDEARHRQCSFEVHSRGGKVEKLEARNGNGLLTPKHQRRMYIGELPAGADSDWLGIHECRFEYQRQQDGQLARVLAYDRPGNVVWTFIYTTPTTAHSTDAQGLPCPRAGSGAAYVEFVYSSEGFEKEEHYLDSEGSPRADRAGIFGQRHELDDRGLEVRTTYLDAAGQPAAGNDGVGSIKTDYDDRGQIVDWAAFDLARKPAINWEGVARYHYAYDEFGNAIETTYFGVDDRPTLQRDGYARVTYSYDDHGNLVRDAYFGLDGKPTLSSDVFASSRTNYDEHGSRGAVSYFDSAGKPTLMAKGCAAIRYIDNERGDPLEMTYLGLDGQRILQKDGISRVSRKYDGKGNMAEAAYFGVDDRPTMHVDGYFRTALEHDGRGRVLAQSYFGTDDKPCLNNEGIAGLKRGYDARGNIVETRYYGVDGRPALHRDRYSRWTAAYDDYGNMTEQTYFGLNGKHTRNKDGYARKTLKYDDHWRPVETAYFGIDGKPAPAASGGARWTIAYDELGNAVEEAYFGIGGEAVLCENNYARVQRKYDEHKRIVEETFSGVAGEPTLHKDGYAIIRCRYDERGNLCAASYFDRDDQPILTKNACAMTLVCDQRGNYLEAAFFGRDGQPALNSGGYHQTKRRFDATGNRTEESYFGLDGKPTLCAQGFFRQTMVRDERGHIALTEYFDAQDRPCPGPEGVARFEKTYDARGNVIDCRLYGTDGKPILHKDGLGYARWTAKYDDGGNQIESAYFGLDFEPVLIADGTHGWTAEYDENGNKTRVACFDCAGKPVLQNTSRAASWTSKYDERGNQIEAAYFGTDGKPVLKSAGFARWTATFDAEGKQIALRYFDAQGKKMPHRVVVLEVFAGSQAERVGLKPGDILTRYDDHEIIGAAALPRGRSAEKGDEPRQLQVLRDGKTILLEVKPGPLGIRLEDRVAP